MGIGDLLLSPSTYNEANMAEYPGSTIYQYVKQRFGAPTTMIERSVVVGTSPTRILVNNPRRFSWLICNPSSYTGYIGYTPSVGVGEGLLLTPNGGTMSMVVEEDGEATGYEVWAISPTAAATWWIFEAVTL